MNQVPQKLTSPIAFFKCLQLGLSMNLINTPMPRVSCPNDENPENHFVKKCPKLIGLVLRIFIISTTNPWHGGVYKVHGMSRLRGYRNCYGGSLFSRHLIQPSFWRVWGVLGAWMTFEKLEMDKTLRNGLSTPRLVRFYSCSDWILIRF